MIAWLLLCSVVFAKDQYVVEGRFDKLQVYQHESALLCKGMQDAVMIAQPSVRNASFLSDFSSEDLVLSIQPNSYVAVIQESEKLVINCYPEEEKHERLKVLIDAGHGGKDCGAVSQEGLKEKHVTLYCAKKVLQYLQDPGLQVEMTRSQDIYIDKYDRLRMILALQPDLVLSIHADAYTEPEVSGMGVFYLDDSLGSALSQQLTKGVRDPLMREASQTFANQLLSMMNERYPFHADKALSMPLVVLRSPTCLSILVELGFISNPDEQRLLADEDYLDALAENLAKGVKELMFKKHHIIFSAYFE